MRKLLPSFLCTLILFSVCFQLPAAAATAPMTGADAAVTGTTIFDGYAVTVLDQTTPAAGMRGRPDDRTVMCFVSADDREVGVISYADYNAIIQKNQIVVFYDDGSSLATPPDGRASWNEWFADEYNKLRGLVAGSREAAVAAETAATMDETAKTIEEYRQEVIRLVNEEREKAGLAAYIINDECMEYSQIRAQELLTLYSHTRPDGTNAGYEIIYTGPKTPSAAVAGWMNSPGHKAAILNENRVYVGAGCHISPNGAITWQMYFERDPEVYANTLIFG